MNEVDYPDNIKQQQQHWIGKSTGAFVNFKLDNEQESLRVYTTRPDTLFGVTFMVIAPEHPLIDKYADQIKNMDEIEAYREECAKKSEFERIEINKDKNRVKIDGLMAVNSCQRQESAVIHCRLCYDGLWYRCLSWLFLPMTSVTMISPRIGEEIIPCYQRRRY